MQPERVLHPGMFAKPALIALVVFASTLLVVQSAMAAPAKASRPSTTASLPCSQTRIVYQPMATGPKKTLSGVGSAQSVAYGGFDNVTGEFCNVGGGLSFFSGAGTCNQKWFGHLYIGGVSTWASNGFLSPAHCSNQFFGSMSNPVGDGVTIFHQSDLCNHAVTLCTGSADVSWVTP